MNNGKIHETPQPKVEVGQFWKDRRGTIRRVVEPLAEYEVNFANVTTGMRSRCQRVTRWGSPHGYTFVPRPEPMRSPVHIRWPHKAGHAPVTFCEESAEEAITSTLENLNWWRQQGHELCVTCTKRATDGVHLEMARAGVGT